MMQMHYYFHFAIYCATARRHPDARQAAVSIFGSEANPRAPGAQLITEAQRYFPALPIILVSPRVGGFSRSFAHFDTTNIIKHINTDEIDWRPAVLPAESDELPF